jgi:DNA polymerase-4
MDAFFAAVEERENPSLKQKALVIGGRPEGRGVVATANYVARTFGIHSAMSCAKAYRLCPQAVFIKPRITLYREVSLQMMDILRSFTDAIEPVSLDEAYLDVTKNTRNENSATRLAVEIRESIHRETGLTASAGIAPNKFLAKIASDMNKPNGQTTIAPDQVSRFLHELPIGKVPGVGKVTERKMHGLGVFTIGQLANFSESELRNNFGKTGSWFHSIARGIDERPVQPHRIVKSVGVEETFASDLESREELSEQLMTLTKRLAQRLERKGVLGKTHTLKITFSDFRKITRSKTIDQTISSAIDLFDVYHSLLQELENDHAPIRLLGVSVSNLNNRDDKQDSKENEQEIWPKQLKFVFLQ